MLRRPRGLLPRSSLAAIFAGQEAVGEAVIRKDRQPCRRPRRRAAAPSNFSRSTQIVPGLQRARRAAKPSARGDAHRLGDPRRGEIATARWRGSCPPWPARRTRRGCRPAARSRRPCAGNRGRSSRPRAAASDASQVGAMVSGFKPRHEADLGRDDDLVALGRIALQPAADQRLALAALMARHPGRIDVGGVDHRPAGVDERVEDARSWSLRRRSSRTRCRPAPAARRSSPLFPIGRLVTIASLPSNPTAPCRKTRRGKRSAFLCKV